MLRYRFMMLPADFVSAQSNPLYIQYGFSLIHEFLNIVVNAFIKIKLPAYEI